MFCHVFSFSFSVKLSFFLITFFPSVYGNLPSESQLADWEFAVTQHSAVPQGILVSLSVFVLIEIQRIFGKRFIFSE